MEKTHLKKSINLIHLPFFERVVFRTYSVSNGVLIFISIFNNYINRTAMKLLAILLCLVPMFGVVLACNSEINQI